LFQNAECFTSFLYMCYNDYMRVKVAHQTPYSPYLFRNNMVDNPITPANPATISASLCS